MTITLLRRVASTRYIFLLSGVAFLLWSLAASIAPEASAISALLQIDFDQSITQPFIDATNTSLLSNLLMLNISKSLLPWHTRGIGVANAQIYVVSLADRQDRREQMEFLRTIQGLTWTVVDAIPGNATLVDHILDWVALQRFGNENENGNKSDGDNDNDTSRFRWPEEINALAISREPLNQSGSDAWAEMPPSSMKTKSGDFSGWATPTHSNLACATENDSIPTFANGTPAWMVLSPAKVACWHSHVSTIRQFVEKPDPLDSNWRHRDRDRNDDVAIILEDDIDMEKDIATRLSKVWKSLPVGWDIVFLGAYMQERQFSDERMYTQTLSRLLQGHCWSDESHYRALTQFVDTNVHPSHYPKCTHAYALSYTGARRVLQHLRYPPFAYSRALDQAYAWLVQSGRLRGYSIVPSVVVQRKSGRSDILPGSGSEWREGLRDGVFEG